MNYGKYIALNMILLLHLIGLKLEEVGVSWAKNNHRMINHHFYSENVTFKLVK